MNMECYDISLNNAGYDDCGDCIDETAPPPECENCEEVKDDCGVCNLPTTDEWNGTYLERVSY